jgi:hypothetical protein
MRLIVKATAVRRLPRTLGVIFFAVCAFGTLAVASASASYNIASPTGGTIAGSQVAQNTFVTDIGAIRCATSTLSGSQASESAEELTLHPNYEICSMGGLKTKLSTGSCDYRFSKTFPVEMLAGASMSIKCSSGAIVYKDTMGLGCEVKFPEQTTGGYVTFANEAAGTVLADFHVSGIKYSWTAACPNAGGKAGEASNGAYSGTDRLAGKTPAGAGATITVK